MRRPLALLLLFDVEALAAFTWSFLTPSESGRGVFLWLSPGRLVHSVILLALFLLLTAVTMYLWRSRGALERLLHKLDVWCVDDGLLVAILVPLVVLPVLTAAAAVAVLRTPLVYDSYKAWAPDTFPLLHAVVAAVFPPIILVVLVALEAALFLARRYRSAFTRRDTWAWSRIAPSLILLLIVLTTLTHWIILAFQLRFLVNIPAWYWKIEPIPFGIGDLWFVLGVLALLAAIYWVLLRKRMAALGLMLVFLLGWFLQNGVGLMAGGGFASLGERYFSTYHKAYVVKASENHLSVIENIVRYEQLYGSDAFVNTKPPGLMAFYIGLDQLINGYPSAYSDAVRYVRLSALITYGFPVAAACMIYLLYAFARRFLDSSDVAQQAAPFLYVLAPSVVLFSLFPDQAIYPLVFLLGVWLAVEIIRRQSIGWGFVLGAFLYAAVFFAFTMLPLYPFVGLYLILHYWQHRSEGHWQRQVWIALSIAAGTIALYGLGLALLHYDIFPRFERTMSINHNFDFYLRVGHQPPGAPESLSTRLGQIVNAAWVNNLDFAAGIGFALYILFAVQALRLVARFFKGNASSGDIILVGMLSSFIVLNLAGTAQGEVPRLWLFWLPMMMMLASLELAPYAQKRPVILIWLALMQLVTIMLTFHFQDLRM